VGAKKRLKNKRIDHSKMANLFPRDIWLYLLDRMPVPSLLAMRATCTRLNEIVIGMQERWFREYHWLCRKHMKKEQTRKVLYDAEGRRRHFNCANDIPINPQVFKPKLQHYIYNYLIESEHHTRARTVNIDYKIRKAEGDLIRATSRLKRYRENRAAMIVPPAENKIFEGYAVNNYKKPKKAEPKKKLTTQIKDL
jgi:hypothetical protein